MHTRSLARSFLCARSRTVKNARSMKSEINEIAVEFIVYGLLPSIYSWLFVTIPLHRLIVPRLFSLPTIPLFRFAWSRKEKNHDATSGISLFSSTCIFAGCKKKKKKKKGAKPVEKEQTIFPGCRLKGGAITGTIIEHCWVQVAIERASG